MSAPARTLWSHPRLAILLSLAAVAAACRGDPSSPVSYPMPAPELVYLGRESSGVAGIPDVLRVEITNFGDYAFELFAEAPGLPPCGQNRRAARTWIELFTDGARNYGYCDGFASPPLPATRRLVVSHDPADPLPAAITVELWDRVTDRRVDSEVAVDPDLESP